MGELHSFLERRNASFHGFFIACDGWMREPDVHAFFARQGQAFISHLTDHWDGVARQAATDETRREARRFNEDLPEMFRILGRLNIPEEETLRESQGKEVWGRIQEQRQRKSVDFEPRSGETLAEECRRRLVHLVDRSDVFRRELAVDCGLDASADGADIIARLWNNNTGIAGKLNSLHRAAKEALKATGEQGKETLRGHLRDILGVSLLGMLDRKTHEELMNPSHGLLDTEFLDLAESAPEVAEICFASVQPLIEVRLEFDEELKRLRVAQERYFGKDRVESGRSFSCDSQLDTQLRLIWYFTFPNDPKEGDEYLEEKDFRRLNKELRRRFERGEARYFLVPAADDSHPLNQEGVIDALKYRLPYLFVFRTGVTERPRLLAGDLQETDIEDELAGFARLF
jgi:hypothetical protein